MIFILLIALALTGSNAKEFTPLVAWGLKIGVVLFTLGLPYINMYILVPRFLFKNKYLLYIAVVTALVIAAYYLMSYLAWVMDHYRIVPDPHINDDSGKRDALIFVVIFGTLVAASTGIKLFQRWVIDNHRISQLENTRLTAELELLKNQVNPHFLFNTLNNAHVLTQKDPTKASQVLLKLSDLLRYQLYDSSRNYVLLSADIDFLNGFLELEKIRRDNFTFLIDFEGNSKVLLIPPFLFITFVENAVKHNMDPLKASYVHLYFKVDQNKLTFQCENSKPAISPASKPKYGGLGMTNVKRRLELLFPNTHSLHIDNNEHNYSITLSIPI